MRGSAGEDGGREGRDSFGCERRRARTSCLLLKLHEELAGDESEGLYLQQIGREATNVGPTKQCGTRDDLLSGEKINNIKMRLAFSLSESSADVASSSRRMAGSLMMARAIAIL